MSAMVYCPAASQSRPSLRCFSITPYNLLVSFVYLFTPYSIFSGAYLTKWFAWPCMGPSPPCKGNNRMSCCSSCGVLNWCFPCSKPPPRQCKKAQTLELQQICLPLGIVRLLLQRQLKSSNGDRCSVQLNKGVTIWNMSHEMTSALFLVSLGKNLLLGSLSARYIMMAPDSKTGRSPSS